MRTTLSNGSTFIALCCGWAIDGERPTGMTADDCWALWSEMIA